MVHHKIDHQFANSQFNWDVPENYQPCIKLSFFFKKLPHVDDDHFQKHYNHIHADLTVACRKFHAVKIQRYVQTYQSPEIKEKLRSLGMDVLDYDGCSQIWVRSWDDWVEFAGSDEYKAALMPDADHFMDYKESGIKVMAGHDLICFGKAIPDVDATGGVLRDEEIKDAELGKVDSKGARDEKVRLAAVNELSV